MPLKILSIVDSYNWALSNRANSLKKHLKQYNFTIKYFKDLDNINFDDFDVVYILNWPIYTLIKNKINKDRKYKLITTISSHIGRPNASKMKPFFSKFDAISCSNMILFKEFSGNFNNVYYTPFGVEIDVFKRESNPADFSKIFGWVGNKKRDVKRFNEIEEIFKSLDKSFVLKTALQSDGLSRDEMNKFYNSIGTLICFSQSEGTPNPILEAAACGRNIISTRVGNVPELIKGNKEIKIVKTTNELKKAIIASTENPNIIKKNGIYLKDRIVNDFSWSAQSLKFIKFFEGK